MKNYKKGLLAVMVLAAMSSMAATSNIIKVTTFEDENGENLNQCSLREAIETARKNKSFGGCNVGNPNNGQTDYIQLEAGEYLLTKGELVPLNQIVIEGKSRFNYDSKNLLTQKFPAYEDIRTTINAQGKSRIFNTSRSEANFIVNNVRLTGGMAEDRGGALYLGGAFTLNNGAIENSQAKVAGGAIYSVAHNMSKKTLLVSSLVQGNVAPKGSVVAMDCIGNLGDTQPEIVFQQSSIIQNGSSTSNSVMDFCGNAKVELTANTIAKNQANPSTGSIIRAISQGTERLSAFSSFVLTSNTIVENNAASTYYYDNNGTKAWYFNVLAYNTGGKSCRYLNNAVPDNGQKFVASNNAFELAAAQCDLPESVLNSTESFLQNHDVSSYAMGTLLSALQTKSAYNLYLPLYYPKAIGSGFDLINLGLDGCSDADQRGILRITDGTLQLSPTQRNTCDIGSVELMNLTAADMADITNESLTALQDKYQNTIDALKKDIDDPDYAEYKVANQDDLTKYEAVLSALKNNLKYRAVYFDPFPASLPQEESVNGSAETRQIALNADNYTVTTSPIGIGSEITVSSTGEASIIGNPPHDLHCDWDAGIKQIVIYRTSGATTAPTEYGFCKYTLKQKTGSQAESSGVVRVAFKNMTPVAKAAQYTISPSNNLSVTVNNLLENANDDGDGPVTSMPTGKSVWHKNEEGQIIPIRFTKIPAGLNFEAEYSGSCPASYLKETCYGGKITFSVKNGFSQFDYPVEYSVVDSDAIASNNAILTLKNTAKNTNSSSSGGGSMGLFGLLTLIGLGMYRQRRLSK